MSRRKPRSRQVAVLLASVLAAVFTTAAFAAKPAPYAPTLSVGWPAVASTSTATTTSTNYVVSGCGYSSSYGGVTAVVHTPVAIQFAGQIPDASGCISVSNFWTQGPGHYEIDAFQTIGKKDVLVASTSFDL